MPYFIIKIGVDSMKIRKTKNKSTYELQFVHEGKRYRKYGFKSQAEAKRKYNELIVELDKGLNVAADYTLYEYFKLWCETYKEPVVSKKTYVSYSTIINILEDNKIGKMKLKKITRSQYQEFINEYAKTHAKASIRKLNGKIKACLDNAVFEGLMTKNIIHQITYTPGTKDVSEDNKFMQLKAYEDYKKQLMKSDADSSLFLFIMHVTGCRYSGVRYLKYEYLNEKDNTIFIDERKTDLSPRRLTIPSKDMKYILSIINSKPRQIDGFPFKITNNAVNKQSKRICKQLGIQEYTSHALRHTHCSYLYAKGLSIEYISKRLGHASVSTTREIYQHMFNDTFVDEDEKAMNVLQAI